MGVYTITCLGRRSLDSPAKLKEGEARASSKNSKRSGKALCQGAGHPTVGARIERRFDLRGDCFFRSAVRSASTCERRFRTQRNGPSPAGTGQTKRRRAIYEQWPRSTCYVPDAVPVRASSAFQCGCELAATWAASTMAVRKSRRPALVMRPVRVVRPESWIVAPNPA